MGNEDPFLSLASDAGPDGSDGFSLSVKSGIVGIYGAGAGSSATDGTSKGWQSGVTLLHNSATCFRCIYTISQTRKEKESCIQEWYMSW